VKDKKSCIVRCAAYWISPGPGEEKERIVS